MAVLVRATAATSPSGFYLRPPLLSVSLNRNTLANARKQFSTALGDSSFVNLPATRARALSDGTHGLTDLFLALSLEAFLRGEFAECGGGRGHRLEIIVLRVMPQKVHVTRAISR